MSDFSLPDLGLLAPAIEAARAALRRLDSDQVPAALRKIAGYSGGTLPPPLARRLVHQLEDSWLRSKALDEWHGDSASASGLFLERPEGWWLSLAALAAERAETDAVRDQESLERRVAELESRLEEARRRGKDDRAEAEAAARRLRRELDEFRKRERVVKSGERREVAAQEAELEAAQRLAADSAAAVERTERYADRLRKDLRRARRERAAAERALEGARAGGAGREGGLELARRLDEVASLARPRASVPGAPGGPVPVALQLPAGVRPDAAEAIEWLATDGPPVLLLVDGYNVSYGLADRASSSGAARDRLNHELSRLAKLAPRIGVVAVYDSSLAGEGESGTGPAGVEVVFAAGDRLADEEIVAMAAAADGPVVVVSSDREVRDGAEQAGALALWGSALVAWIRKRS